VIFSLLLFFERNSLLLLQKDNFDPDRFDAQFDCLDHLWGSGNISKFQYLSLNILLSLPYPIPACALL
jgi:hypothetical protein